MKISGGVLVLTLVAVSLFWKAAGRAETPPDFYAYWGDGLAELSSYRVVHPDMVSCGRDTA